MKYTRTVEGNCVWLAASGRYTHQDGGATKEIIHEVRTGAHRHVVMDLTGLDFIDSSGIGMLLLIHEEARPRGKTFSVIAGEGQTRKALQITHIPTVIPTYDDRAEFETAMLERA